MPHMPHTQLTDKIAPRPGGEFVHTMTASEPDQVESMRACGAAAGNAVAHDVHQGHAHQPAVLHHARGLRAR
ncbi:hypothetical protein AVL59_26815 [Streptomyces griseochromogenes]|nr:hypothetical protein AVL59_26815 [Streptomyces griseochromogenes]